MADSPDWLEWCQGHRSWLAAEFIRSIEIGNTKLFFGSWFNILGYKQSGYYLGHEVICAIEREENMQLSGIAFLKDMALVNEKTKRIAVGIS